MYCYIGGKGSGKTYSCVQNVIIPALNQGIPIRTNISLNKDLIYKDFIFADIEIIDDLTLDDILSTPNGYLLVIDEIQLIASAGITYSNIERNNPGLLEFFSKSRHKVDKGRSLNIVVISQTLEGISKPIRMLLDVVYSCRKLSAFGMSNKYQIRQFEVVGGDVQKTALTTATGTYNKNIYKYYNSNSQNTENNKVVNIQEKMVKEKTIFSSKLVKFMFLAPFLIAFFVYLTFQNFFNVSDANKKESSNIKTTQYKNYSSKLNKEIKLTKKQIKYNKINELFGFPKIYLNGLKINDIDYFILKSELNDYEIKSMSSTRLKKLGFDLEKISNNFYIINGNLVTYKADEKPKFNNLLSPIFSNNFKNSNEKN